jgi:hypothetical protein
MKEEEAMQIIQFYIAQNTCVPDGSVQSVP